MQQGNIKITELQLSNDKLLPEIVSLLNEGHTVTLRLRGYSMRPFLEDGRDKALLTKPTTVKVGDPVLAEISKGKFVLHRIVSMDNGNVILRGDGNLGVERCTTNDIRGAVIGFYRKGREVLDRTDGLKWKVYSYIWTALLPVRRYLLFIYRHLFVLKLNYNLYESETRI
ncbi:MAG: S24/S26 family peptidase [Prevotella sp.]